MRPLSLPKKALVGLDISRHAVRMVELSRHRNGALMLERYGSEYLGEGAVSDDGIDDLEHVIAAARRLWARCGSRARRVAIGIPAGDVLVHTFSTGQTQGEASLAAADREAHLEALARERITPLLNYDVENACIDFCLIDPALQTFEAGGETRPETRPETGTMLVAAARRESVEDRMVVAESLGLQTVIADANSYAAHAALAQSRAMESAPDLIALFHLEQHGSQLSLYAGEHVIHVRQCAMTAADTSSDDTLALEQTASAAAQELRSIQHDSQIHRIVLSGTGAMTPGLADAFQKHTGIATGIANPFFNMSLASGIDAGRSSLDAAAYLIACGLALRRFD